MWPAPIIPIFICAPFQEDLTTEDTEKEGSRQRSEIRDKRFVV
jgi:hypothetical protein